MKYISCSTRLIASYYIFISLDIDDLKIGDAANLLI